MTYKERVEEILKEYFAENDHHNPNLKDKS